MGVLTVTKTFYSERNMEPLEGLSRYVLCSDLSIERSTLVAYAENRVYRAQVEAEGVVRILLLKSR